MSSTRPRIQVVRDPLVWEKVLSPVRYQIMETMRYLAPCAIAELAAAVGRHPVALYRHVRVLKDAGFLVSVGFRKQGRQTSEVFDLVADDFRIDFSRSPGERAARDGTPRIRRKRVRPDDAGTRAVDRTVRLFLREAESCYRSSSAAGEIEARSPGVNFALSFDYTWLTPESFQKARAALVEYLSILAREREKREGRVYCSLMMLQPVTARRRRSASAQSSSHPRPKPRRQEPQD